MHQEIERKKIIFLLKDIYKSSVNDSWLVEIINFSEFEFKKHWNSTIPSDWLVFDLDIHLDHLVFAKLYSTLSAISRKFKEDINNISELTVDKVRILPDYEKMTIVNSEIRPVYTKWEEINDGQEKLLSLLKTSGDSFDFMNIGNTSRAILQKVSDIVYNHDEHKPTDITLDVSSGKFKNRLHSYIKAELKGDSNRSLRQFAESAIETVEKSIDLSNTLTHKLAAERIFAEVCIIGTISAISIIKLIESRS